MSNNKSHKAMQTANYFYSCLTDLVRKNHAPFIKEAEKGLYSDYDDFVFGCKLRYIGIKQDFPDAEFVNTGCGVSIFVQGVLVYEHYVVYIDPEPVKIPDEDE